MSECFIAIAGNIGVGKSTLTAMLAEHFGWTPFYEANAENPYLEDFYQDMLRWSFHSQMFFLGKRLEHHHELYLHPGYVVQDRTVYEDAEIFARNLFEQGAMSERDYATYCRLYKAVAAFLPAPNVIVYLQASTETLLRHIRQRGRAYEQAIDPHYLARLNALYDAWIDDWTACPVLRVDMDRTDFQKHRTNFMEIARQLQHILVTQQKRDYNKT